MHPTCFLPREVTPSGWMGWLGGGVDWTWAIGLWGLAEGSIQPVGARHGRG